MTTQMPDPKTARPCQRVVGDWHCHGTMFKDMDDDWYCMACGRAPSMPTWEDVKHGRQSVTPGSKQTTTPKTRDRAKGPSKTPRVASDPGEDWHKWATTEENYKGGQDV